MTVKVTVMTTEKKVSKLDALKTAEREKASKVEAARNKKIVNLLNETNPAVLDAILDALDVEKESDEAYADAKAKIAEFITPSESDVVEVTRETEPQNVDEEIEDESRETAQESRTETAQTNSHLGYGSAGIHTE